MNRILFLMFLAVALGNAQPPQLDMSVFAARREAFMTRMQPRSAAVFPSAPECTRNLDVEYEYRQESNFYYLSGFEEPESILLLNPSAPRYRYVLFVRKRSPQSETYEGPGADITGAMSLFSADTSIYVSDFEKSLRRLIPHDATLYYTFGINRQVDDKIHAMFVQRRSDGNWPIVDPAPIVAEMRLIKRNEDFAMGLERAITISARAHVEAMRSIRPGMYEYEVQAVFEYIYRKNGSPRNAYPCIIGSGPNTTTLHYSRNSRIMNDGELVLMDCGAEYGYYAADITRTVPVNGKFSREQREVYNIVLEAQKAALRQIRPGVQKSSLDKVIDSVLAGGLVRLGLMKNTKDLRLYTLHGYGHWLGLDVHDVGNYTIEGKSRTLEPGMVFTVEPGIYIRPALLNTLRSREYSREEIEAIGTTIDRYANIAVRIEDDVVVTPGGYRLLSGAAPREIEEIERIMREGKSGRGD